MAGIQEVTRVAICVVGLWAGCAQATDGFVTQNIDLGKSTETVTVPIGFRLELVSSALEVPRIIHRAGDDLLIGSRSGSIYRFSPPYDTPTVIARLKGYPHSVVVHEDHLYVALTAEILRTPWPVTPEGSGKPLSRSQFSLVTKIPGGGGHSSRTLKVGPDDRLYVSLGITGNCSNELLDTSYPWNDQRGGFSVIEADAASDTGFRTNPYASGLRNPVGFDWHPQTGVMYASNNGPDHLGYEIPRESFAKVTHNPVAPW